MAKCLASCSRPSRTLFTDVVFALRSFTHSHSPRPNSRYVTKLPIVFLLGVATSADALNQVLWRGVTNLLDTATFFVEPGIGTFNALMRGVSRRPYRKHEWES